MRWRNFAMMKPSVSSRRSPSSADSRMAGVGFEVAQSGLDCDLVGHLDHVPNILLTVRRPDC